MGNIIHREFYIDRSIPGQDASTLGIAGKLGIERREVDILFRRFHQIVHEENRWEHHCTSYFKRSQLDRKKNNWVNDMLNVMTEHPVGERINFEDFVIGVWAFGTSESEDLVNAIFQVFDKEKRGELSKERMLGMVDTIWGEVNRKAFLEALLAIRGCTFGTTTQPYVGNSVNFYSQFHRNYDISLYGNHEGVKQTELLSMSRHSPTMLANLLEMQNRMKAKTFGKNRWSVLLEMRKQAFGALTPAKILQEFLREFDPNYLREHPIFSDVDHKNYSINNNNNNNNNNNSNNNTRHGSRPGSAVTVTCDKNVNTTASPNEPLKQTGGEPSHCVRSVVSGSDALVGGAFAHLNNRQLQSSEDNGGGVGADLDHSHYHHHRHHHGVHHTTSSDQNDVEEPTERKDKTIINNNNNNNSNSNEVKKPSVVPHSINIIHHDKTTANSWFSSSTEALLEAVLKKKPKQKPKPKALDAFNNLVRSSPATVVVEGGSGGGGGAAFPHGVSGCDDACPMGELPSTAR